MPAPSTAAVSASVSTVTTTRLAAWAKRSSSTSGRRRWTLPWRSALSAWISATSGASGGTATSRCPVNGHSISAYSGCRSRIPVPATPRTGMNGSPYSAARSCCSSV